MGMGLLGQGSQDSYPRRLPPTTGFFHNFPRRGERGKWGGGAAAPLQCVFAKFISFHRTFSSPADGFAGGGGLFKSGILKKSGPFSLSLHRKTYCPVYQAFSACENRPLLDGREFRFCSVADRNLKRRNLKRYCGPARECLNSGFNHQFHA